MNEAVLWKTWKNKKLIRDKKGDGILEREPENIQIAGEEDMVDLHVQKLAEETKEFLAEWRKDEIPPLEHVHGELVDVRDQLLCLWERFSPDPTAIPAFCGDPDQTPAGGFGKALESGVHSLWISSQMIVPPHRMKHRGLFLDRLAGLFVLTEQIARRQPLSIENLERRRVEIHNASGGFTKRYVLHLPD